MDFFQAQDNARQRSKFLVVYFLAAVISIIAVIYAVTVFVLGQVERQQSPELESVPLVWWQPTTFALVAGATLAVILLGSLFKSLALRGGGGTVARSLGGVRIDPQTTDAAERRLLNVVEEMAIASGVRVPEVYLLPEPAINAFAAGLSPDDAAIAVTQGTLTLLNRDELQGVVAHEFSHILNGDMRLNVRLIGLLFGILLLAIIGRVVLQAMRFSRGGRSSGRGKNSGGMLAVIMVLGLTLLVVGYVGVLFGRMIQAAVSRQREYLADAAAVQFTRNPPGLGGALKKIGGFAAGSRLQSAHATETAHLFFANALSSPPTSLFATHPPLVARIRALEPNFDGRFPPVTPLPAPSGTDSTPERMAAAPRGRPAILRPEQFIAAVAGAAALATPTAGAAVIAAIPETVRAAAHDPARVRAIVLALLADTTDPATGQRQAKVLGQALTSHEVQAGAEAVPQLAALPTEARLALVDLALPALRALPPHAITEFLTAMEQMVLADYRVSPFEFAIQHIVRRNLQRSLHHAPGAPVSPSNAVAPVQSADIAAVLATIARAGNGAADGASGAYTAGARHFGLTDVRLPESDGNGSSLAGLATVVQRLERITPGQKKKLLESLAAAASRDGAIEPDELALLRAFAAALDCPAPLVG